MSMLDQLMDMGFSQEKAEGALKNTGEKGLDEALNWLIENQDKETTEQKTTNGAEAAGEDADVQPMSTCEIVEEKESAESEPQVQSIVCNQCGSKFASMDLATLHAEKTGHQDFAESSEAMPESTPEERRVRSEALREKIRELKALKEKEERKKAKEMEKHRRAQGQDFAIAKQRLDEQEMKKIAADRKRQKMEDKLVKQRVLDQIKADREAKKREAMVQAGQVPEPEVAPAAPVVQPPPTRNYDECRLQIRLTNGKAITNTFGAKEELASVRLFVEMNRTDGDGPFRLMTSFPKKVFTDEDMEKPLSELGLVPSAVIIVTRAPPAM